jgi:hypothetical protein
MRRIIMMVRMLVRKMSILAAGISRSLKCSLKN